MKISKSKQELALIISENGGWRGGARFAWFKGKLRGRPCHEVWFGEEGSDPEYVPNTGSFHCYWPMVVDKFPAAKFNNWHQTTLSRDEYFHLYPAPVEVVVENKTTFHLTVTDKPTIEHLAAEYLNAKDYAHRKQQEADDAKADAEAKLKALELAGEALGLLVSPITAKQEPELAITDWRDLRVGDVIELTGSVNPCWKEHSGSEMTVKEVYRDQGDNDDQVDLIGESGCWSLSGNTTWRFIRRP